jgi:opacity protein-like surface antigen
MRPTLLLILAASLLVPAACFAQFWEVGGAAGSGFGQSLAVTNPMGTAMAGLANGPAFGYILGHSSQKHLGGELRYTYSNSDLKVSQGTQATFKGLSHSMHYDLVVYPKAVSSRFRPFLSVGGGFRVFRGTGKETAYQQLSSYALLTKTQEWKPLITPGGGIKFLVAPRVALRVEFRDYITPFPKLVIAPAPGAKLSGWLHDFVPMVGVTFVF